MLEVEQTVKVECRAAFEPQASGSTGYVQIKTHVSLMEVSTFNQIVQVPRCHNCPTCDIDFE